jgi:acetolactate synthase-1/2/3 large subunit
MTQGWDLPLPPLTIRIDVDADEIERNLPMQHKLVGDAKATLAALDEKVAGRGMDRGGVIHPILAGARAVFRSAITSKMGSTSSWERVLRDVLPRSAILSCDMSLFWADMLAVFPIYEPRTILFPWGFGTLGFAVPEAIGAKISQPNREVVAVCGDGAFLFTGMELATAVQNGLPIPIIVPNNNAYGMIKAQQRDQFDGRYMGVELQNPDFVALAHAFGAKGERATTPKEMDVALRRAFAADKPTVIEIPWRWTWGNEE